MEPSPDEASAELHSFDGLLPDDWYRIVVLTAAIHAAAEVGDESFLRRHLDELRPFRGLLACAGSGGVVIGPVSLALARAAFALRDTPEASEHLAAALEQSRRLNARPWLARSLGLRYAITTQVDDWRHALLLAEHYGMTGLVTKLRHDAPKPRG